MSERFDVLVIGTGAAGLSTALAARGMRVAVVSKGVFGLDGSSCWAQGGIAAAVAQNDSPAQHAMDTLLAGSRSNNKMAVRWMVESAPDIVRWLAQLGVQWDRNGAGLMLSREAAHSVPRVVHAGGDSSGAEIMRALRDAVSKQNNIHVIDFSEAERLIRMDGHVVGAQLRTGRGESVELYAPHVVLATGGLGQLYRYTSNPSECDGSGLALAAQVGAAFADLEFVQFHPTALASRNRAEFEQLPLVTEALRGAGARLVNDVGLRFMADVHAQAELAPRDVVARAVWAQMEGGHECFLDARLLGEALRTRFPTVFAACSTRGIDPRFDLIPIVPVAHYHMGGIKVDMHSMSSVAGLYAVGEVACTGVHGANRLASNSLLEAVSFGRTLGERLARQGSSTQVLVDDSSVSARRTATAPMSEALVLNRLKNLMWSFVGLARTAEGLANALEQIQLLEKRCLSGSKALNQLQVARLVIEAAVARKQSLGAHFLDLNPNRGLRSVAVA